MNPASLPTFILLAPSNLKNQMTNDLLNSQLFVVSALQWMLKHVEMNEAATKAAADAIHLADATIAKILEQDPTLKETIPATVEKFFTPSPENKEI